LRQQQRLLQALSPQHWLERGFSLIINSHGQLIGSVQDLVTGERVTLRLADGDCPATVEPPLASEMTMTEGSSRH
jgi:exodeoxyribonuclease VII large subunit